MLLTFSSLFEDIMMHRFHYILPLAVKKINVQKEEQKAAMIHERTSGKGRVNYYEITMCQGSGSFDKGRVGIQSLKIKPWQAQT